MALSPCVQAIVNLRGQRKGCPVSVLFLGCGQSNAAVLNALAGREMTGPEKNGRGIREIHVGSTPGTKILFTAAPSGNPDFGALRSHLLRCRPANVVVYLRSAPLPSTAEEVAFLDRLESALGKSLWQNAVCVAVVHTGHTSGDTAVPPRLLRPGFQPTGCCWDGSPESTSHLAALVAEVATNTLPFIPEPEAKKTQQDREVEFGDLDLISSNNLTLAAPEVPPATQPRKQTAEGQGLLVTTPQNRERKLMPTAATELADQGLPLPQLPMVPAFASLSLAFSPALTVQGTALLQTLPTKQAPPSAAMAPGPAVLRGLSSVRAAVPVGSASQAPLALPSVSSSLSSAASLPKVPASSTAFPDALRLPRKDPTYRAPSGAAGAGRVVMVWFRNDLRVHDNEALAAASKDGCAVLPVYCFDPRDYGKSSSGFDRTGPFRAKFLLQCVSDLRQTLRARGSDLVVRVGRPEKELLSLAKAVGASALYAHQEVTREDGALEKHVADTLKGEGVDSTFFWGSTLYHLEDLPFTLDQMPCNYGGFREAVKALQVRKAVEAPQRMRQLPSRGNLSPGDIPTLAQLGLSPPNSSAAAEVKQPGLVGGEGEAMNRLKGFLAEAISIQPLPPTKAGAATTDPTQSRRSTIGPHMLGASFSCKISPWLATGCLSPRRMFDEMQSVLPSTTSAGASPVAGTPASGALAVSLDWLVFELLWRDFFRFITKKHSSTPKEAAAPVPA